MSLTSSSSRDETPSKIHVETVGFRRPQMMRTTMSGVTRIARLPTLVIPPLEGNLQLIATTTPTSTASPAASDGGGRRGMLSIDRRTGILTARRKVAQKAQQVDGEERRKTTRVRPESLPLVVPNGCIRSNGSSTGSKTRPTITEIIDNQEPPIRLRALPPLRHCVERKKKPTRIHPILSKRDDTADTQQPSAVVCTPPQLGSLRRPTPDSEETVNLVTPLSQRTPSVIVELGIQTDDNFDRDIALVTEQLVASAISRAIESLKKENEIARLRRQAQSYKELFNKLHHSTKFTIEEKNKVIESLKHEAFLRYTRNLAQETCNQITEASLAHVAKLEEITPKTRSIGLDTRSMNRHLTKLQLMTTELEEDFFPWIFARADRMFRRAMTTIQLENMLIRRTDSFRRLKFEII